MEHSKLLNLIQSTDATFGVRLVDRSTGDPFDLTAYGTIQAIFLNADCSKTIATTPASGGITVISAQAGRMSVSLSAAQTALLPTGDGQSFEVALYQNFGTTGQIVNVVQFLEVLNVDPRISC
jgi:hypothetical protein